MIGHALTLGAVQQPLDMRSTPVTCAPLRHVRMWTVRETDGLWAVREHAGYPACHVSAALPAPQPLRR
jgi:hypothetical protein